jgi:hypothetical protein
LLASAEGVFNGEKQIRVLQNLIQLTSIKPSPAATFAPFQTHAIKSSLPKQLVALWTSPHHFSPPFLLAICLSPIAVRHSLLFWLGTPKIRRLKSALRFLRHQLRVETRSMDGFSCVINCGPKSAAWLLSVVPSTLCQLAVRHSLTSFSPTVPQSQP